MSTGAGAIAVRAAVGAVVVGCALALASVGGTVTALVNVATVVVLAVALMSGARRYDALRRTRRLLLCALAAAFVSGLMPVGYRAFVGHAPPTPWVSDLVALLYVPFTVAGLLSIPSASRRAGFRARAMADGGLAASSLWYLLLALNGHAMRHDHGLAATVVALAYPVGDVFVVATALTVLARCCTPARRMVAWMTAGLSLVAANDLWLTTHGAASSPVAAALYEAGLLLLVGAAAAPPVVSSDGPEPVTGLAWMAGALPFVPLFASMAATARMVIRGVGMPNRQVLPALVVAVALSARQLTGSREMRRLILGLRARERELYAALRRDDLTGLANRLGFSETLTSLLAVSSDRPVALAVLDINDFKLINDNHGHGTGDEVLRVVARRLQSSVRCDDVVARLGGDEFAVIAAGLGAADYDAFAHRLVHAFRGPVQVGSRRFTVAASVGIVTAEYLDSAEELLAHADAAMYQAKELKDGGTTVSRLTAADRSETMRRLRIREEIARPDLAHLSVRYQPIVDLATGRIRGIEALLRWNHPELGSTPPEVFIPLAEQAGTIHTLGNFVLATAVGDLARLAQRYPDHRLAVGVNVSPQQLIGERFVETALALVRDHRLQPDQLVIEITEQAFEADLDTLASITKQLIDEGVSVAVDDFGTGYSSLRYLQQLSLDIMKIDRTFVANMVDSSASRHLVTGLISVGTSLDLQMIAEGIENLDQLRQLQAVNCELGQGYLFSEPRPIEDIETLIATGHAYPVGSGDATPLAAEIRGAAPRAETRIPEPRKY